MSSYHIWLHFLLAIAWRFLSHARLHLDDETFTLLSRGVWIEVLVIKGLSVNIEIFIHDIC